MSLSQRRLSRCVLQVAPILPHDVRNQLLALEQARLLMGAASLFSYAEDGMVQRIFSFLDNWLGTQLLRKTSTRRIEAALARRCEWLLWTELVHLLRIYAGLAKARLPATDHLLRSVDQLGRSMANSGLRLTIAREDACVATFAASHQLKARCLYDLPTCHYSIVRSIMEREELEFPNASLDFRSAQEYHSTRNYRKDKELAAADHVLVASQFVQQGLIESGYEPKRITTIPYGCEPRNVTPSEINSRSRSKVVLYVGNLSLRKGMPRLLRAWKRLGAYRTHHLRLIGTLHLDARFLSEYSGCYEYIPRLPRSDLWAHYARASAFVFPSVADGFGLVLNEALSSGVPVIASENTGAPGFITSGQEGILYQYDDEDALCSALDQLLSQPAAAAEMGIAAHNLARRWTWQNYRKAFIDLIIHLLSEDCQVTTVLPCRQRETLSHIASANDA